MSSETAPSTAARIYVLAVIIAGAAVIAHSIYRLHVHPVSNQWLLLAALTLLSGSFTVKVPKVPSSISVSETFVIISVLVFGPAAATITVAFEGMIISFWILRRSHEVYRTFFNMGAAAISIWTASHLFFFLIRQPTIQGLNIISIDFLLPLAVFTTAYFVLNSSTVALAVALSNKTRPMRVWKDNFAWLSLNYFGGASVAVLLVQYTRDITPTAVGLISPFLLITYLTFKAAMGRVEDATRHLVQLNKLHLSTIETLAMAIDAKDQITHGHIRRVQGYAVGLARAVGVSDQEQIKAIEAAALLHDMGKLAVPEHILNKPGKLTPAEFDKMKAHATVGADILSAIEFPYPVVPIVRHHHECWAGNGYPDGLAGTAIPIGARILAVVDCYDALTSDRPYRPKLPHEEAIAILRERRGSMYDPVIVDAFISVCSKLNAELGTADISGPSASVRQSHAFKQIIKASATTEVQSSSECFDDTSASTDELLALYDLSKAFRSPIALADVGDVIAKHVRRMIPASLCVFYVYDYETDQLVVGHSSGVGEPLLQNLRLNVGDGLSGWVAANRTTIINSNPVLDLSDRVNLIQPKLVSAICAPLVDNNQLVGVLALYSEYPNVFSQNHRRVIEVACGQVASVIASASNFDHERRLRLSDAVTGLPNDEYLRTVVHNVTDGIGGKSQSLSLLYIHVRGLQEIYSNVGREVGDLTLTRTVGIVRRSLRGADILFRHGATDFVVLLTHTNEETAKRIAQRITYAANDRAREAHRVEVLSDLEICCGCATVPTDARTLDDLIHVARERLTPCEGRLAVSRERRTQWTMY
jgi:diguanylate cyclase (GGDEF)-like protein/putative nucleotidyltransferase with HDIG domain